jgi:pyruvate dehydrogenase E2 component (dihydrolipoamide acetyltransferase)
MAEVVSMPKLGFDMAEGTLVRWVVSEGGEIAKGAVLAEIETDKATVEVESAFSGVVAHHLVKEGTVVPVSTPIAVIGQPGEAIDLKALGLEATVEKPAAVVEPAPETTPAVPTNVGTGSEIIAAPAAAPVEEAAMVDTQLPGGVRASPLARKLATERGLDLRLVKGSGPGGRITKDDVQNYQPSAAPVPVTTPVEAAQVKAPALTFAPRTLTIVPVSRLRSAIARRMTEAKQQIPHFYVSHEYKMEALMALRKQVNALLPESEKVSVNDFLIKAVSLALREFPNLNASVNTQKNEIIQHGAVNMGVAVAVEGGLLTVVCKDADLKPLRQVATEIKTLVARARGGKVRPEDIEGSTFSISNLGMYDVENFLAIINPPEAAILAVGSVRDVPVVEDGVIKPGLRMKATISVDHRVSDGAEGARFMLRLAVYLEEPLRLMI